MHHRWKKDKEMTIQEAWIDPKELFIDSEKR
jgi:hypothetical protein